MWLRSFGFHGPASILLLLLFASFTAPAQQKSALRNPVPPRQAKGRLTVTCTVVSSVSLGIGPGQRQLILANAAGRVDNESLTQQGSWKNDGQKSSEIAAGQKQAGKASQANGAARVP